MIKTKKGLAISTLILIISLLLGLFVPVKNVGAYGYSDDSTSYPLPTNVVGELFNESTGKFSSKNLTTLKKKLGSLYNDSLQTEFKTSADIVEANNKTEYIVTLGKLTWIPVYLSTNTDGEIILTLWLSDSTQLKGKKYAQDSTFNEFGQAMWSDNWYGSSSNWEYPSSMYGTSYMRSVVLNNGGDYAKNTTTSINIKNESDIIAQPYESIKDSVFSPFTTGELKNYIVSPSQVSWQKEYNSTLKNTSKDRYWSGKSAYYTLQNEVLGTIDSGWYGSYNISSIQTKSNYANWGSDKLWLPSLAETGFKDNDDTYNNAGLWNITIGMRSTNISNLWLRSGASKSSAQALIILPEGNNNSNQTVNNNYAVRPALHLNLTTALDSLDGSTEAGVEITFVGLAISGTILFGLLAWVININKQFKHR